MNLEIKHLWSHKCPKKWDQYTLVALVITIIILLILAGIAISQLTDSGLFEKSKLAKEKWENSQEKENDILAQYENAIVTTARDEVVSKADYDALLARVVALENNSQGGGFTYDTIYSDTANKTGTEYTLSKSINDYKFIIVFTKTSNNKCASSLIIDKSNYQIGTTGEVHVITPHASDSYRYFTAFYFPTETSMKIQSLASNSWGAGYIYLIKGVK